MKTVNRTRAQALEPRSRACALLLLVLFQLAQPILAVSAGWGGRGGCGRFVASDSPGALALSCCCAALDHSAQEQAGNPGLPSGVSDAPQASGCCASEAFEETESERVSSPRADRAGGDSVGESRCDCRMDPVPQSPAPGPLPLVHCQVLSGGSPEEWVRVHAEWFSRVPSVTGPAFPLDIGVRPRSVGAPAALIPGAQRGGNCGHAGGSWVLIARGVRGFLAVLAVDRN